MNYLPDVLILGLQHAVKVDKLCSWKPFVEDGVFRESVQYSIRSWISNPANNKFWEKE